jgi:transcriptional regulator with XRE-family HTH domain
MRQLPDRRRISDLLYLKIRQSGYSMRDVSRAMGLAPDRLSRLLKGQLQLRIEHIYETLEVLGLPPAAFWSELESAASQPPPRRPFLGLPRDPDEVLLAGITRGELLEEVRRVVREELQRRPPETGPSRRASGGDAGARSRPAAPRKKPKAT